MKRICCLVLVWSACGGDMIVGERLDAGGPPPVSVSDQCGNGLDDDMDLQIDEGCFCLFGEVQDCFPNGKLGACGPGTMTCNIEGSLEWGRWNVCEAAPEPQDEICDGTVDDDCDGAVDEGCPCTNGETRACGDVDVGACQRGTQTCQEGVFGSCEGAIFPTSEVCDNGIDDDCDGTVDNPNVCACVPAPELCDNGIDDDCDGVVDELACSSCEPRPEICGDGIDQDCSGEDLACDADAGAPDAAVPDVCVPRGCDGRCGSVDDGCGGTLSCGPCDLECGDGTQPVLLADFPSGAVLSTGGRYGDRRPLRRVGDEVVVELEYAASGARLEKLAGSELIPATPFARFGFSYFGDHGSPWVLFADDTRTGDVFAMRTIDIRTGTAWIPVTPAEPARPGQLLADPFVSPEGDRFLWFENQSDDDISVNPTFALFEVDASTGELGRQHDFGTTLPSRVSYLGVRNGRHHWYNRTGDTVRHYAGSSAPDAAMTQVGSLGLSGDGTCRFRAVDRDDMAFYLQATCTGDPCGGGCSAKHFYILRMPFADGSLQVLWELDLAESRGRGLVAGPYVDGGDGVYFALDHLEVESCSGSSCRLRPAEPYGIVRVSKTPGAVAGALAGSAPAEFAIGRSCIVQLGETRESLVGWPR
ncbi:MAG: MopE-related protein [Myxococcota bacterium]